MKPIFSILLAMGLAGLLVGCSADDPLTEPSGADLGTLVIQTVPDSLGAQWTCTHEAGEVVTGRRDTTLTDMAVGTYTLNWEDLFGYTTPSPMTRDLLADSTLTVTGVYGPGMPPPPLPNGWLFDVLGTAADDVYAVGTEGTLVHFDGTAWTRTDLGVASTLVALARTAAGDLWACGEKGRLFHHDGMSWEAEIFGTVANLYALGDYGGVLHAGGLDGALRRYQGGVWEPVGETIVSRDRVTDAPLDTFQLSQDLAAITTVNHFGIGGAYRRPDYTGDPLGLLGTQGMVLSEDPVFPWRLDPLDMNGTDASEWVLCSTSDSTHPDRNYLGTSTGGLFRLQDDGTGRLRWQRQTLAIARGQGAGIRDLWLDPAGNLYLVTEVGQVVYLPEGGAAEVLFDGSTPLMGVWGVDPANLWVVGLWENRILHLAHDPGAGTALATMWDGPEPPPLLFPAAVGAIFCPSGSEIWPQCPKD